MALADVCVHEKWRSNVQNESEHRFTSYFILLNSQEQKFDDRFLLQIESLTTQGQYQGRPTFFLKFQNLVENGPALGRPTLKSHRIFEVGKKSFFLKKIFFFAFYERLSFFDGKYGYFTTFD